MTYLDSHDRDTAHQRTNAEIDQRRFRAVGGNDLVYHISRKDSDECDIT